MTLKLDHYASSADAAFELIAQRTLNALLRIRNPAIFCHPRRASNEAVSYQLFRWSTAPNQNPPPPDCLTCAMSPPAACAQIGVGKGIRTLTTLKS
jgi:hypothetical protein